MIFNLTLDNMQNEEMLFYSPSTYENYTVTELTWLPSVTLQECAFYNCTSIGVSVFYRNSTITSVNFPKCSALRSSAFFSCSQLTTARFEQCEYIAPDAFTRCSQLTTIEIPNAKTIGSAFISCWNLSTLSVPNCSGMHSSALLYTNINNLTYGISVDSGSLSYLTSDMWRTLKSVTLPSCTVLGPWAFLNCQVLEYISIPECTEIGERAFAACYKLSSITLPKVNKIDQSVFSLASSLANVYLLSNSIVNLMAEPSTIFYYSNSSYVTTIHVPASLVSAYKSATNWALMSDKIVAIEEQE